ncbi:MAG: hypothetical protein MZU97_02800 [Bacillus subtilis]|nr:hypothetical protein [Bacillus subtilis]
MYIQQAGKAFYNQGYEGIKAIVDSTCCNPEFNAACLIIIDPFAPGSIRLNFSNNKNEYGKLNSIERQGISFIITGCTAIRDIVAYDVMKMFNNGIIAWTKRFNSSNNNQDRGNSIALIWRYLYCWNSYNGSNVDIAVIKMLNNGDIAWTKRHSHEGIYDYGNSIALGN